MQNIKSYKSLLYILEICIYANKERIMSRSCSSVRLFACPFTWTIEPIWTILEGMIHKTRLPRNFYLIPKYLHLTLCRYRWLFTSCLPFDSVVSMLTGSTSAVTFVLFCPPNSFLRAWQKKKHGAHQPLVRVVTYCMRASKTIMSPPCLLVLPFICVPVLFNHSTVGAIVPHDPGTSQLHFYIKFSLTRPVINPMDSIALDPPGSIFVSASHFLFTSLLL